MESLLTPQNIMFVLGIMGVIFGVYHYFKNPQINSQIVEALLKEKFEALSKEIQNLKDNHIHTLENKIADNKTDIQNLALQVTRLGTIIDERIPKK